MGLDIGGLKNLVKCATGTSGDDANRLYVNPDFPGRADGVDGDALYDGECVDGPYASYSTYSRFRNILAGFSGKSASDYFHGHKGPFWELINFSDCEGTLGVMCCQRLLVDFDAYADTASKYDESFFRQWYASLHQCLKEVVAGNGVLTFG